MREPFVADRKVALWGGVALFALGSLMLWDAFDGRGMSPPWPFGALLPF